MTKAFLKFMFSKKATKIEKNLHRRFDTYLVNVKSTVKIWSIFVAFLENVNFNSQKSSRMNEHETVCNHKVAIYLVNKYRILKVS